MKIVLLPVLGLYAAATCLSSPQNTGNPLARDQSAIQEGASLFRANCSWCHGSNGHGGSRGPDLSQNRWVHGGTDDAVFRTITQGVPGTAMPANSFEDNETWALVAYIRSLSGAAPEKLPGDAAVGERLFFDKEGCAGCHMVRGRGGHLGPDLSRVGASRSLAYLVESMRNPDKELSLGYIDPNNHYGIPFEYDAVTVTMRDGKRILGIAKDEDAFSIQLLGQDDLLYLLSKRDVADVRHQHRSLMPAYDTNKLSAAEEQDLVAFLSSLR